MSEQTQIISSKRGHKQIPAPATQAQATGKQTRIRLRHDDQKCKKGIRTSCQTKPSFELPEKS